MSVTTGAIESIREMISEGELRPGDRLPPEHELAERLGVSRGSLREAVRALSQINVLDVRRGDGTYVTSLSPTELLAGMVFAMELLQSQDLEEVLEVRRLILPQSAALAAQRGLIGHARIAVFDPLSVALNGVGGQSFGAILSHFAGVDLMLPTAAAIAIGLFYWIFRDGRFRRDREKIASGTIIGAGIAAGWFATSYFAIHLFEPVQIEAGSFVMPLGDAMLQIITVTGALPDYGVGLVVGVLAGAALRAWHTRDIRWEACDDARELSRHLGGAFLMGTGGVFALGCTIGQGVSAASLMAVSAPIAVRATFSPSRCRIPTC